MARQRRLNLPGAIYHVITRGINRMPIFKDRADRKEFLGRFAQVLDKTGCRCYAWALMSNHLHLLIHTSENPLSNLMKKVLTGYACYFNRRHRRCGYLYQNRYKSILCQEDPYLLELVRYIHLNPGRAGVVKNIEELDTYPWTGHSAIIGNVNRQWQSTQEILERFGIFKQKALSAYRDFIKDGWFMEKRKELSGGGLRRSVGGDWAILLEMKKNKEYSRGDERILGDGEFVAEALKRAEEQLNKRDRLKRSGWNLEKLANKICEMLSISKYDLKKKGRENNISFAKGLVAYWGCQELGMSGAEIGRYLGMSRMGFSKAAKVGEKMVNEKGLKSPWQN